MSCGNLLYGPYYCGVGYDRISDAMNNPDGTQVLFNLFKKITAVFDTCFYIEEPDRTRGIKVMGSTTRSVGESVMLSGTLHGSLGERCLVNIQELSAAPGTPLSPLMFRVSQLGGRAPDDYTEGLFGTAGLYNVGLLVRLCGRVTSHGTGWFYLNDGSGAVRVHSDKTVADGDTVGVTGVCTVDFAWAEIRTRQQSDVMIY